MRGCQVSSETWSLRSQSLRTLSVLCVGGLLLTNAVPVAAASSTAVARPSVSSLSLPPNSALSAVAASGSEVWAAGIEVYTGELVGFNMVTGSRSVVTSSALAFPTALAVGGSDVWVASSGGGSTFQGLVAEVSGASKQILWSNSTSFGAPSGIVVSGANVY